MRVLVPLPDRDFDVTEVAVPWRVLTNAGHHTVFATERGHEAPLADPCLLEGVIFGKLGAYEEPKRFYRELTENADFRAPIAEFWTLDRPVGAICHGVLVLARAEDPVKGRSVIAERRTTCLPKYMERGAYYLTAWRLGRYYRTYPAYVEDEVTAALASPDQFIRGPRTNRRGTATDHTHAFVVQDGPYLSARWPGDAYLFAERFSALIEQSETIPDRHSATPAGPEPPPLTK